MHDTSNKVLPYIFDHSKWTELMRLSSFVVSFSTYKYVA